MRFTAAKPALGRRRASARSGEAIHHATAPNAAPLPQPRSITNKHVQWPANGALKPQNSGTETNRRCTEPSTGSWNQQAYGGSSTRASGGHRNTQRKQDQRWKNRATSGYSTIALFAMRLRPMHQRPVGLMDKASASGAGDSRLESWAGQIYRSPRLP